MGNNSEDDIHTVLIQKLVWLPPVTHVEELPLAGVAQGTHCFVEGEDSDEEIWEFDGAQWVRIDQL